MGIHFPNINIIRQISVYSAIISYLFIRFDIFMHKCIFNDLVNI